ncbi:MAG: DUF420 domain-containing protein [Bacillaceae bacterium]|jgi:Predicted membrane protein|uniref:Uncharacterized protein n=2 Tax=Aeribacillus TaxID=1055323 RepID=A0A163YHE1_9BACI|nr:MULTISPECIES: DUF420 domain-containing protein [Aeribacillus]REJ11901.1 MAG: DUF420 domain-containing protein [Bacillaceae bacterium]KZM53656.1 hypothetical protein A3Q35_16725 [Aeribacillus pallidus]KZN94957.1 hypothetical protein AZI98_16880 [Aeribacillus pallidus]MDR9796239.1 DUF420 domain-containing protein [Aeribacillus pallidus]MED0650316.1 DUF420 domain-containing protein [Aeribacillus composti]
MDSIQNYEQPHNKKNYTGIVVTLSVIINAVILLLFFSPLGYRGEVHFDLTIFPRLNAIFNSFTFVFLLAALYAIKKKNIKVHRNFIIAAFTTTTLFCISYLTYHFLQSEPTRYGGEGFMKTFYLFILTSHSILAAVIVPLALFAFFWGMSRQVEKHRKIVRWAMPIWLYVSFTGVLVYILISPYY